MSDASIKPRVDTFDILHKYHNFKEMGVPLFGNFTDKQIKDMVANNTHKLTKDDVVFWQYPIYINKPFQLEKEYISSIHKRGAKVIALIHDVDYLRGWQDSIPEALFFFDGIITPSKNMSEELRSWGIVSPITEMGPYTFITKVHKPSYFSKDVYYCGSTYSWKTSFLSSIDFNLNVYGSIGKKVNLNNKVKYLGELGTNELVSSLTKGYGFIWDEEVSSKTKLKEYLAYNLPYKLSLYIASGIPIICKKHTNVGDFVEKQHIGFTVNSMSEIKLQLLNQTVADYSKYLKNLEYIYKSVVDGKYLWDGICNYLKNYRGFVPKDITPPLNVRIAQKDNTINICAD